MNSVVSLLLSSFTVTFSMNVLCSSGNVNVGTNVNVRIQPPGSMNRLKM